MFYVWAILGSLAVSGLFILVYNVGLDAGRKQGRAEVASGKVKMQLVIFEENVFINNAEMGEIKFEKEMEWHTEEDLKKMDRKYTVISSLQL